jgi:FtsZ-binding cell division protein ZapB
MTISLMIGIIGGLFGLMGLITVAVIVVRSNIATTTATLWQGEAAALKNKNERLESDAEKLTKESDELKANYKILENLKLLILLKKLFLQVKVP